MNDAEECPLQAEESIDCSLQHRKCRADAAHRCFAQDSVVSISALIPHLSESCCACKFWSRLIPLTFYDIFKAIFTSVWQAGPADMSQWWSWCPEIGIILSGAFCSSPSHGTRYSVRLLHVTQLNFLRIVEVSY